MNIFFLAHGSQMIGMGHIMRCLALAEELRFRGNDVCFLSKFELGIKRIKEECFKVIKMPSNEIKVRGFSFGDHQELLEDISFFEEKFGNARFDILIVDSYNVSERLFENARKWFSTLVYIDDLNAFSYNVDILVNGTAAAPFMSYKKGNENEEMLLGLSYNMLRKEFQEILTRKPRRLVRDVFITTGASDPYYMSEKILDLLTEAEWFHDMNFHVIIGGGFEEGIYERIANKKFSNITIYSSPDRISDIMKICDFAITSGGSTLYELAACGIPSIVFQYSDNQHWQIKILEQQGIIYNIGDYKKLESNTLIQFIEKMRNDFKEREKLVERLIELVDGKGVWRIAERISNQLNMF